VEAIPAAAPRSARQSTLRDLNLGLVLRTVCGAGAPVSRADVARLTGTTRATASRLVDELVAGELLDEVERTAASGRGRPPTLLAPGSRVAAVGLQVDARLLGVRVLDLGGRVLAEHVEEEDLAGSDAGATLARLGAAAGGVLARLDPAVRLVGAGLALPGIVDDRAGVLLRAPNLGWSDERPAEHLAPALPVGVGLLLGNEADLAARTVAEAAPGRPGRHRDFLYLSGQIGIGGAAVLDGRVVPGTAGWAGEVGHVCVDPAGPACRCGSTGCLERYAGRAALLAAAGLPPDAAPADLVALVARGDATAERAVEEAARALGIALGSVLNVLDIPTVVLGGHLAELHPLLRDRVAGHLRRRVLSAHWRPPVLDAAPPVPGAGASGAALRALAPVLERPADFSG
jgi:predicted NBD/HSP70 family sugar kinase